MLKVLQLAYWADAVRKTKYARRRERFEPYETVCTFDDINYRLWISDPVAKKWYDRPTLGNVQELEFAKEQIVLPGDVVFDCGCHQGLTTLLFSQWVGSHGKVVAFEALPENYEVLCKNLKLNAVTNVESVCSAVGATQGSITLDPRFNSNVSTGEFGLQVSMVNLDQFANYKPTLLKIDVEGYEAEVLKGAKQILATRPKIILELHDKKRLDNFGTSAEEILDLLGLEHYQTWILTVKGEKPMPYQGERIISSVHLFLLPA